MNVDSSDRPEPDASWWNSPEIRPALASRDVAAVCAFLRRRGVSQRTIAGLTGLAVSEIYEITKGRRIMAYDVLCRIADGLRIPRGSMGLAFDNHAELRLQVEASPDRPVWDDVSVLLSHAAAVTLGLAEPTHGTEWHVTYDDPTPPPTRLGESDLEQIETITAGLRSLDRQHGGGACREAVLAQTRWVSTLVRQNMTEAVRLRFHVALADLHNLAGWTSFDVGLSADARRHYATALGHARQGNEPSLVADILYRVGRLHLHARLPAVALRFFQLGQIAAHDGAGASTVALLCANEAWAYGMLGDGEQARRSFARAEDELTRAHDSDSRPWISFFGTAELTALAGMMYLELSGHQREAGQLGLAEEKLRASLSLRGQAMSRSRGFELAGFALVQLREGNTDSGLVIGHQAADLADRLRSIRLWERFSPLAEAAIGVRKEDADGLSRRIEARLAS